MAWINSLPISVGELAGQFIGFSDMGYSVNADFNIYSNQNGRYDTQQLEWLNTEFSNQIDISEYFTPGHADFDIELAGINIVDENKNVTARFVCKLSKSGNQWHLNNRLETPSGSVIAYIMRSQGGNVTLSFDQSGNYATGIWKVYLALSVSTNGTDRAIAWVINDSQCGSKYGNYYFGRYGIAGSGFQESQLWDTFGIAGRLPEGKDKSPQFGPASEEGGYGPADPGSGGTGGSGGPGPTFDGTSDPWVDTPTKPGVLSFGLLNLYKCDNGALNLLGETLFPTIVKPPAPPQTGVTDWVKWSGEVAEWIGNVIFAVSDSIWNKDLIDYIVSVHLIPVDVTGGALEDIKVGPRTLTGILARPIEEDVIEFDCGTVHVDEYYTSYIDYTATRCRLYIPFYGMVTIKPEYWQSADISLKYLWNVMDGSFIAKVYSTITRHQSPCTTMIGQYSGAACVHMPLSGANYASMFSQLTGAAGGMAMGAASGNVAMAATSAMALPGALSTDMQTSNAYNASSAFYGHARPYLIIERAISHFPTNYSVEKGLPLLVTKTIGSCSGFTIAESPILDGVPATLEEKERIKQFLQNGVIIK